MPLINCPNCGKEISDKALACPQCGMNIIKEDENKDIEELICTDCGAILEKGMDVCPNCGCPVESQNGDLKNSADEKPQNVAITSINISLFKKRGFWISIISVIVVVLAIIGGIKKYNNSQAEKYAKTYYENMQAASSTMLLGASTAEEAGGLIHDVWYNKIYDKYESKTSKYTSGASDFNAALAKLFADSDFQEQIDSIKSNQSLVNDYMKDLKSPPDEYKDAYEDLKEYYDSYVEMTNLVVSPTGSLQTYTSNFNDADSKVSNCYKKMQLNFQ